MRRPKHIDTDKPTGYIKLKFRRWARYQTRRDTNQQVAEYRGSTP